MPVFSIENADVFDGVKLDPTSKQYFQGSPGDILAPQSSADIVIDGTGCTLMPGLIDCKIDLDSSPAALSTCATFGITTVIDSISSSIERQAMQSAASENPALPSYLATGSAIGPKGANFLTALPYRGVQVAVSPAAASLLVEGLASSFERGQGLIKIILDQPGLDLETIAAAVTTAHEHGCLVIGHASQIEAYQLALHAGLDIVTAVPVDGILDDKTVRGFAQNRIGVVPTLSYLQKAVHRLNNEKYNFALAMAAVKQLHDAGVPICAGTSASMREDLSISFGHSLHEELQLLFEAGLSKLQVIRAATCVPSAVFKLHDRGTIQQGNRADLILVEGNPLEDLNILKRIKRVWVTGIEIDINS